MDSYAYKTPNGKVVSVIVGKEDGLVLCDDGWTYEKSQLTPASREECDKKWGETIIRREMLQAFMDREG